MNSRLTGKVPDAGKDWGQKEKRASEDEMAGRHHQCNEHELGQIPGDGEGQRGLACCSPWGHKESDTTERLNWTEGNQKKGCILVNNNEHGFIIFPWCWERSRAEGEEGVRGWDGWTASPMQRTWMSANSGRWCGTGRPGVLQSLGSQGAGNNWATEQQCWSR